jgi:hypothetical protein
VFAGEVASRAALAVDNARLYREAGEQRDLYEALLRTQSELGEAFALIEDERIVFANAGHGAHARPLRRGAPGAAVVLRDPAARAPRRDARADEPASPTWATAGPGSSWRCCGPTDARPRGAGRQGAARRRPLRLVVIARDITERRLQDAERERLLRTEQAARRASEAAHARVRLLADVSGVLEGSFATEGSVQDAAELVVGPGRRRLRDRRRGRPGRAAPGRRARHGRAPRGRAVGAGARAWPAPGSTTRSGAPCTSRGDDARRRARRRPRRPARARARGPRPRRAARGPRARARDSGAGLGRGGRAPGRRGAAA